MSAFHYCPIFLIKYFHNFMQKRVSMLFRGKDTLIYCFFIPVFATEIETCEYSVHESVLFETQYLFSY